MKQIQLFSFSLASFVLPGLCLCLPYVSASSSSANNQSLKPKRLRNETTKSVLPNKYVEAEAIDPYIGLALEDLDDERKQQMVDINMSMILVESMTSSQPTNSMRPTFPTSSQPTHSPTIDDPNFGKVEGKTRHSATAIDIGMLLAVAVSTFVVLLISGFLREVLLSNINI
mmetsp:Transcript_12668/g.19118  ORF Transcript_12668/g.19118 Transcript_12668/m.19118 type:complete len:171 (-) Transcript_12668:29-541(-)